MPSIQQKKGDPRGGRWTKLESTGDVARLLRWLILQTKADKIDAKKASVMGQLALYLMKALETSDLEARLATLERALEEPHGSPGYPPTTH
jgi:hypothetical protein